MCDLIATFQKCLLLISDKYRAGQKVQLGFSVRRYRKMQMKSLAYPIPRNRLLFYPCKKKTTINQKVNKTRRSKIWLNNSTHGTDQGLQLTVAQKVAWSERSP